MATVMRAQCLVQGLAVLTVSFSLAAALARLPDRSLAALMQQVGGQWERIAGAIIFDRVAAIDGIGPLVGSLDELGTHPQLNSDMRQWLADTRAALIRLEHLLREQRREEAWAQRGA